MPGAMAPLKKPRNPTKLPLALNPMKSKDVLAVLAERNQAIVPVGAWVEPASPNCSEIPAHTSAYMIEKEIKEQQRKKQESLKHFQRQVRQRVSQRVKLRKEQQLQKSYRAAEKEGFIAMQCSDSTLLTLRTSVFPSSLNAAIGSCSLPPSQVLGDATENGENQNQLFQQQAQALSQTMKQARHQLASFKTVSEKKTSVFLNGRRKSSSTQEKALLRKPPCIKTNKETREEPAVKIHGSPLTTKHYQNFMESQDFGCGEISSVVTGEKEREDLMMSCQQDLLSEDKEKTVSKVQEINFKEPFSDMTDGKEKEIFSLASYQCLPPKQQVQDFIRDQDIFIKQPSTFLKGERESEELPLESHQYAPPQIQDQVFLREQRQKQYLRHRRLFMDIERAQVKEQNRQKEQKKRIERMKKRKEQQRYAEEQRLLKMNYHEELCSEERLGDSLAQLQLEEVKESREKQHQREKEYVRYVEALRAQVQEKMKLYNITLPPLCCCGPDFWDAHPDTCANNCIFYKNYRAYNRALHSVINSSDITEGNATLRNAIRNFASVHRRTSKKSLH